MAAPQLGSAGSVSRIECSAQVVGGGEVKLSLYRHLTPLTVNAIMRTLPIESRVTVQQSMVSLFTTIKVGVEKARMTFEKGDVAFLASSGFLCIFFKNVQSERPLNPVGRVDNGIELLESLRPGAVVRITQMHMPGDSEKA